MLRFFNIVLAIVALGLAVACGRQVTPESSLTGNLAGQMILKMTVAGSLSLAPPSTTGYTVVINTSGNTSGSGGTPSIPQFRQGNYQAFSYAFVVGASTLACGGLGPTLVSAPELLQYYLLGQNQSLGCINRPLPPTLVWVPAFGGQTNEFEIIFSRSLLTFPSVTGTPGPSGAPSPTPTATASVAPTPTASGGSPSPTPVASPTTAAQKIWYINFFTTDPTGIPLDAMGGGINANGFNQFAIDTTASVTNIQQNQNLNPPSSSAQILSAEVDNIP